MVNFTWEKTGGIGVSNSTTGNMFSVAGNRPQQNLFLLNGVEFTGAAENNMQPGGASQQLLGVDAVREFNLLQDTYGAEYGKHPGGQVTIVTQSGTNQWHGSLYEYLRNNALDAPNFFDVGLRASLPAKPVWSIARRADSERQDLRVRQLRRFPPEPAPDIGGTCSRCTGARPMPARRRSSLGLLNLWPVAPAGAPDFPVTATGGVAEVFLSPLQSIREDFGTVRVDHVFSSEGFARWRPTRTTTAAARRRLRSMPISTDLLTLREQVFSLEETHVFSPNVVNTARFGFSRAGYFFTGEPTPGTPAATVPGFIHGHPVGAVVVGGSQASNPQAQLGLAGSNNGSNLHLARNLFTYTDQVAIHQRAPPDYGRRLVPAAAIQRRDSPSANTGR